jgi:hypothetical protein
MVVTIRQLCKVFAATAVIGSAIGLPTSASAKNEVGRANIAYTARSHLRLGSDAWDPGGGDFRWNYGGLSTSRYWTHAYEDCVPRRRIFINRRGHRVVRWVHVCY